MTSITNSIGERNRKVGHESMNVAFYYHALPPVDDMLTLSTPDDIVIKPSDLVEGWKNSEINAFIVVGVTDKQIRELYAAVKKRADAAVAQMKKTFKAGGCDAYLKRLYRFDTGASAKLYVDFLTTYLEEDFAGNIDNYGFYEDCMRDLVEVWFHYEEPWVFARELTEQDWEAGGLFCEGFYSVE